MTIFSIGGVSEWRNINSEDSDHHNYEKLTRNQSLITEGITAGRRIAVAVLLPPQMVLTPCLMR